MSDICFLPVCVGGFGGKVGMATLRRNREDRLGVDNILPVAVDTNRGDIDVVRREMPAVHLSPKGLNAEYGDNELDTIQKFPLNFDRQRDQYLHRFLERHAGILTTLAVDAGAGTRPLFGELIFRVQRGVLIRFLSTHLSKALATASKVQPIVIGSGGGGTSKPGILEVCKLLGSMEGLSQTCSQGATRILKPWVFFMPPIIQARLPRTDTMALRPLSNCYAFIRELDILSDEGLVQFVMRLMPQNGHGSSAENLDEAADLMADNLLSYVIGHAAAAGTWCDGFHQRANEPGVRGLSIRNARPVTEAVSCS